MRGLRDRFEDGFITAGLEDVHVHTESCDDAEQTATEALRDASNRGLNFVCFTAHVRKSTSVEHVQEFVSVARKGAEKYPGIEVRYSVETKLMNSKGELDLPPGLPLDLLDTIHISDHRVPLDEARSPTEVREWLDSDRISDEQIWEALLNSYLGSLAQYPGAIVAHPLSIIPKIGMDVGTLPDWFCSELAKSMAAHSAVIEINNKWKCPGERLLSSAHENGVPILNASDAHKIGETGSVEYLKLIRPTIGLGDGPHDS